LNNILALISANKLNYTAVFYSTKSFTKSVTKHGIIEQLYEQ